MDLDILRLLFDFGLFVLIWIVQLTLYPGFRYYNRDRLIEWHSKYTQGISYIVAPLMFGQTTISIIQLWNVPSWYTISSFLIIASLWAFTFFEFVPLHNKISKGDFNEETLAYLVKRNWWRTFLWTTLLFLSLLNMSNLLTQ